MVVAWLKRQIDKAVALDELQLFALCSVKAHMGDRAEALATLQADETIDYSRVVAVMNQLRQAKGASLGMATQQPVQKGLE